MNILFVTKEPDVCFLMASFLPKGDYVCAVHSRPAEIFSGIDNDFFKADFIVMDFRSFEHTMYEFFDTFSAQERKIPVIFYNDPYPEPGEKRVSYWLRQNKIRFGHRHSFTYLMPVLTLLDQIIERPDVHPYISLLQPPAAIEKLSIRQPYRKEIKSNFHLVEEFRRHVGLCPALLKVFDFLYECQPNLVSVAEISSAVFGKSPDHENSVYSYISRLRCLAKKKCAGKIEIVRGQVGKYALLIRTEHPDHRSEISLVPDSGTL